MPFCPNTDCDEMLPDTWPETCPFCGVGLEWDAEVVGEDWRSSVSEVKE